MIFLPDGSWDICETKHKGRGLFAKRTIPPGVIVGDYTGKVVRLSEFDFASDGGDVYLLCYHDRAGIYPDRSRPGLHLLNHSCAPNCWLYTYRGHTLAFTLRHIFPGEELTISYLLSPDDSERYVCRCESFNCQGTMCLSREKYKKWRAFQDAREGEDTRARIRYGHELKLLSSYPKLIQDNAIYDLFGNQKESPEIVQSQVLPDARHVRELICKTGRILDFPKLNLRVCGVENGVLIMGN
jgi:hypothetical protein